jgi:hypothetical protein
MFATKMDRARAARGAKLLDKKKPGWEWHEGFDDLASLDISKSCDCVLGKLYEGEAFYGTLYLGQSGFMVGLDELDIGTRSGDYGFLGGRGQTEAWREIITAKRAEALEEIEEGLKTEELATV